MPTYNDGRIAEMLLTTARNAGTMLNCAGHREKRERKPHQMVREAFWTQH
jgi:hypothetical protein